MRSPETDLGASRRPYPVAGTGLSLVLENISVPGKVNRPQGTPGVARAEGGLEVALGAGGGRPASSLLAPRGILSPGESQGWVMSCPGEFVILWRHP